jgi:glycosyltransferase involved in cell wall biosynthesis
VQEGDVVFSFVGAMLVGKGVIPLARAFTRLTNVFPTAHLALAGLSSLWDPPLTQDVPRKQLEAGVHEELAALDKNRVHVLGNVAASEMPSVYAASDVVVVPSVWREAFGLVALEAMASARAVIASRSGGLVEVVNARTGILVEPGDEVQLLAAMHRLAESPQLRTRLGLAGQEEAKRFSWESAGRRIDQIYAEHQIGS